jgi:hypothetical protein
LLLLAPAYRRFQGCGPLARSPHSPNDIGLLFR